MAQDRESWRPNEPIVLGSDLRLRVAEGEGSGRRFAADSAGFPGKALLRMWPRPSLEIVTLSKATGPGLGQLTEADANRTLEWGSGNRSEFFRIHEKRVPGQDNPAVRTVWAAAKQPIRVRTGRKTPVSEIRFLLLNFPPFFGRGKEANEIRTDEDGGWSRHGCLLTQAGPWSIELNECDRLRDVVEELHETRGFAPTHHGRVVRTDGGRIETHEACQLLRALDSFLSFARGARCSVALARALDANDDIVWEQWGCRRVDPWNRWDSSWFDCHHGHALAQAFPGFWRVYSGCRDERRALHEAIYWYLRSGTSQSGVDGGLILLQAALERLAHTFFRPKQGREQTAEWLRKALTCRQIPVKLPVASEALGEYVDRVVKNDETGDALFAVTRLRNNAVHPRKDSRVPDGAYFQAWQLTRCLVELIVLHVTGYTGEYANRLTRRFVGQVETVPWARRAQRDQA